MSDEQWVVRPETDLDEGNASPDATEDYRSVVAQWRQESEGGHDVGVDPDSGLPIVLP